MDDYARLRENDGGVIRDILYNNTICTDTNTIPNFNTANNFGTGTYIYIFADNRCTPPALSTNVFEPIVTC